MPSAKRERQREGRQVRLAAAMAEQRRRQRWRTVRNFAIVFVVIVAAIFVLSRRSDNKSSVSASSGSDSASSSSSAPAIPFSYGETACANSDGSSPQQLEFVDSPKQCIDATKTYTATFDTSAGTIVVKLDTTTTPGTTNNFVTLARYHYYDGIQIFRFAQSIGIIQSGARTNSTSDPGPGYALADEGFIYDAIHGTGGPYSYNPGDLVMARKAEPNGAGSQFFFAVNANAASLDTEGVYVKFGTTTQGLDVLEKILAMGVNDQPPTPPVMINTVTISES